MDHLLSNEKLVVLVARVVVNHERKFELFRFLVRWPEHGHYEIQDPLDEPHRILL